MKNKKPTVTIGIPAYNEQANIASLIKSLIAQDRKSFRLIKILVVSDGSTDSTVAEIRKIRSGYLKIIVLRKRKGLNNVENLIIRNTHSDILVILNADILPTGKKLIKELVEPFKKYPGTGMVGGSTESVWPETFAGRVYANSHRLKQTIFNKINHGETIYLCHGPVRAFAKSFYMKLHFPDNCPEDAYSYLLCIKAGYKFRYARKAAVYISPATTFSDQIKQSVRFFNGKRVLEKAFSEPGFVRKQYELPLSLVLPAVLSYLVRKPLLTGIFLLLLPFFKGFAIFASIDHSKYEISESTKILRI